MYPSHHLLVVVYIDNMEKIIYEMLVENTGIAMMDSGGSNGRMWQRNQGKTLEDFQSEPEFKKEDDYYIVSLYHYLKYYAGLSLDDTCDWYNHTFVPAKNWDSDIYGVSREGAEALKEKGYRILDSFNSYNGESSLSQVIQGTYITNDGTDIPDYVLLQVHGGCDVRGGYTDARMFKLKEECLYPEPEPELSDIEN